MTRTSAGSSVAPIRSQPRRYRRPEDWLLAQLPSWMLDDDLFRRFVSLFQTLATTHLEHADQLEHVFDPTVAPAGMVRLMSDWIGLDVLDPDLDEERQRAIVLEMAELARWRGTRHRLQRVLELITDEPVEIDDSGGVYPQGQVPGKAPHVAIRLVSTGWADGPQLLDLVNRELPASVSFELWIGTTQLWPRAEPPDDDESALVTCPQCGAPVPELAVMQMAANEFCAVCDFPLFWAQDRRGTA